MTPDIPHDLHEGSWLYVSAQVRPLEHVVAVCRQRGWPVIVGTEEIPASRRAQALRLADACIVDASVCSPHTDDELRLAIQQRRPVVALRRSGAAGESPLPPAESGDVRELTYRDNDECAWALDRLLADPDWQRRIALAAPSEHG